MLSEYELFQHLKKVAIWKPPAPVVVATHGGFDPLLQPEVKRASSAREQACGRRFKKVVLPELRETTGDRLAMLRDDSGRRLTLDMNLTMHELGQVIISFSIQDCKS